MPRNFAFTLLALVFASSAFAADVPLSQSDAPEKMLPPTTQLFVRWDGITAHNEAYKKSIWGGVMAGPTGDSIREMIAKGPKLIGATILADPLLDGQSPIELKKNLDDLKAAEQLVDLIAAQGVLVAAEVREPAPTIRGVGAAIGGLIGGKLPGAGAVLPDGQIIAIVPNVGEKAGVLFSTLRLVVRKGGGKTEPFAIGDRKGVQLVVPKGRGPIEPNVAWWVDGKHFVFYAGTRKPAAVIAEMQANVSQGGVTGHPLFQRCIKLGNFEGVTRGFIDTGRALNLAKSLAGPFVPGLKERLDSTGISGVKAVVFSSGFDGKESRARWEFDVPGERKGITKVLVNKPLGLKDLPPMPPDVSRFSALRLDPAAAYDAGLGLIEFLTMTTDFGVEDSKNGPTETIKTRKAYLAREADKFLGISVTDDLLPYLGDKLVVFQSPSEGLQVFGTVVCISVKDVEKIKIATDRLQGAIESIASSPIKVRKKMLKGVEIREFYARGFAAITPTYAIVGDWLVVAGHPQAVQGLILRSKGTLEKWEPDAETTKRLAKLPADGCGLQYCSPKSTAGNLCCIGPLVLSLIGVQRAFNEAMETDFNPIDVGLVPNAHEMSRHLFPNLTVTRDDGKTISVEVSESFSLPAEVVGAEPFAFAILLGLNF